MSHSLLASPVTRREALARAAALLGAALTPSLLTSVMRAADAPSTPGSLSATHLAITTALADRILPRTDTPGALDVGVPAFINLLYGAYLDTADKTGLEAALDHFETAAQQSHARDFAALTAAQQDALLTAAAASSSDRAHFGRIRELTIVGYFTSETVGKEVLHYDPVPGPFQACVPLSDVGNISWTHSR